MPPALYAGVRYAVRRTGTRVHAAPLAAYADQTDAGPRRHRAQDVISPMTPSRVPYERGWGVMMLLQIIDTRVGLGGHV